MQRYLQMLYRRNRANNPFDIQSKYRRMAVSPTDGASKFAHSVNIPSQKFAELVKHSLPEWYEMLRKVSKENPVSCSAELGALQSLSSLNQGVAELLILT